MANFIVQPLRCLAFHAPPKITKIFKGTLEGYDEGSMVPFIKNLCSRDQGARPVAQNYCFQSHFVQTGTIDRLERQKYGFYMPRIIYFYDVETWTSKTYS